MHMVPLRASPTCVKEGEQSVGGGWVESGLREDGGVGGGVEVVGGVEAEERLERLER